MKNLDTTGNLLGLFPLEVEIYPNPSSSEVVYMRLREVVRGKVYVFDPNGKLVLERELREGEKEISLLLPQKGTYYVVVEGNEGKVGWQVVVRE